MFDVGFFELLLIGLVALLVLGPERLPRAARTFGLWLRRARAAWYSVQAELERELAAEELRRSLAATESELTDARRQLESAERAIVAGTGTQPTPSAATPPTSSPAAAAPREDGHRRTEDGSGA